MKGVAKHHYCAICHQKVIRTDGMWNGCGWCAHCKDTVATTRCKVSYWMVTATMVLTWFAALPKL